MQPQAAGIWGKLDTPTATAPTSATKPVEPAPTPKPNRWAPWRWRIVNLIATAFWLYAICKVFIFDFDQYAIQRLLPGGGWIVTYRFFILLALASVWAVVLRRWAFFFWMVYFALFPIILVVWWLPRAIYKSRSWIVVMAVLNIVTTLVQDFTYSLVTKSAAL